MFLFFTHVLTFDVVDRLGRWVGHPYDFTADLAEAYPRLTSLVVARGTFPRRYYVIPWNDVSLQKRKIVLKQVIESLSPVKQYRELKQPTLRRNILDQQVVDTFNRKVVRVNDLHFLHVGSQLRLAHVDVGFRGLIRRLGWQPLIDRIVKIVHPHADYLTDRQFISWKFVQPLSIQDATGRIQLNVGQKELRQIPPPDISEMLLELDPYQRAALLKTLDVDRQIDIITELDLKWQKDLIEGLDLNNVVALIERMPADEATDLMQSLSTRDAERIMNQLSTKKARELGELMEHEQDSAGGLMTTEYMTLTSSMNVGEAIDHLRKFGARAETLYSAFVVDEEAKLVGSVNLRRLLLEPNEKRIAELMQKKPPAVHVQDSVKEVGFTMDKYNLFAIPVIDDHEVLEGIITIDDLLSRVIREAWGERSGL